MKQDKLKRDKLNIAIIGFGNLGSHLYHALKNSGKVNITGIVKTGRNRIPPAAVNNTDVIFITTQDTKIRTAVKSLAKFKLKGKYIYHTSGSLTSDELKPLAVKGAITGSFHPVQTFEAQAKKDNDRFRNIYIAIEGDAKAVKRAKEISGMLGAKSIIIPKEEKALHHICCVIASNFTATLMRLIEKTGERMKSTRKQIQKNGFNKAEFFSIYKPLAVQTLENIASRGAVKSLTGPIERNDLETIKKHLNSISYELLPIYILLGIETVNLSLEKKSITPNEAKQILKTFDNSLKTNRIH